MYVPSTYLRMYLVNVCMTWIDINYHNNSFIISGHRNLQVIHHTTNKYFQNKCTLQTI